MPNIALKDILIRARQESYKMRHFYLGAEHLFIALLEIKGGLATSILQAQGLTPEYVTDAIRRKVGKGGKHRLWAGTPNTPRLDRLIDAAHHHALADNRKEINERDLLVALLEERDSAPIRVLEALGLADLDAMLDLTRQQSMNNDAQHSFVRLLYNESFDTSQPLSKDQLLIMRRMFSAYAYARVERRLAGGYTNAMLFVVTPIHADNREDAPVIVKIDDVDTILDEARRYETYVKASLPPLTARLEDRPVAPEDSDIAGIKYTLIAGNNQNARDLRATVGNWEPEKLGQWLYDELYPVFGRIWWRQNRPFRFQVWREYDWLLPPILTLEYTKEKHIPADGFILKFPIRRARLHELEYGDTVTIENFIVQKVHPERDAIQLAISHGSDTATAYKVEVRGIDLTRDTFYRGEVIEHITGRVWGTRAEHLADAVRDLEPDFELDSDKLFLFEDTPPEYLPNPLKHYEEVLDLYVNGALSTIHGDLHLGNIMIGPNNSAFLIDFARTRDGHTVFDWACLEVSMMNEIISPVLGTKWSDIYRIVPYLVALNSGQPYSAVDSKLAGPLEAIQQVRLIAGNCLVNANIWTEYYVALSMSALRAVTWTTMSIPARRLMFVLSALSIQELRTRYHPSSETDTPSPDETDLNNILD